MIARVLASLLAVALLGTNGANASQLAARFGAPAQWWRCTGHLGGADGHRYDFSLTIFRYDAAIGTTRPHEAHETGETWAGGVTYAATLGIVDEARRAFSQAERHERAARGIASAAYDRIDLRVADWTIADASPRAHSRTSLRLRANTANASLDLDLDATKPPFAFSDGEVDVPSMRANGSLAFDGVARKVRGDAWLDTTFGTRARAAGALGWDRFTIELDDGRAMLYAFERKRDGSRVVVRATLFDRSGRANRLPLAPGRYRLGTKAAAGWRSLVTGARYPNVWGLNIPELDMQTSLEPVLYEQEIVASGGVPFWSGAVEFYDVRPWSQGLRLGRGYVELTGYAKPVDL